MDLVMDVVMDIVMQEALEDEHCLVILCHPFTLLPSKQGKEKREHHSIDCVFIFQHADTPVHLRLLIYTFIYTCMSSHP